MSELSTGSLADGPLIDAHQSITFTFAGRSVRARRGQSIAAALYAAGVRIFSRSFKYHRPRGLFCVAGDCPNCLMQVDGRPNVRTCIEPARKGQVVRAQNAWPSLKFDVLRLFDYLSWFLPVGFYYKRFHKPRWLWPLLEPFIRRVAGLGRIDVYSVPETGTAVEHLHADICVIGAGPSGMAAAMKEAAKGGRVLLVERQPWLGGHWVFDSLGREDQLNQLRTAIKDQDRLWVLPETTVFGLYEDNLLGAFRGDTLLKIRAREIHVCTGSRQRPFLFSNNDLPGIFLSAGILRLARIHGVKAGQRAVVLTDNDDGSGRVAEQLQSLGIGIAAVVDLRPAQAGVREESKPWPLLKGHVVIKAVGNSHLKAVRVAPGGMDGSFDRKSQQDIACDLLCMASRGRRANELLLQGGTRFRAEAAISIPPANAPQGKRFVCFCEDVSEKDLAQAVAEGFDNIETLKRYSTVNMGPCQGKMCGQNAVEICARLANRDLQTVGVTTSRPPLVPVDLCVLAADRHLHPIRRTPLHHWHEAAGATWMDAGQWKRPEHYGDPLAEVRAVRSGVGLIDVSTLGKIELVGPDAAKLLDQIYLNKWSDLAVGRIRYGAMCTEEGILFDDGVGARLATRSAGEGQRFYLTATTGNAEAVFMWLQQWTATWGLDVTIINETGAMAAMNLAGPRAREVLSRVTTIELSPTSFPYMAQRAGEVAGVPCLLLRIGFVGELGYEIHCPSAVARHLWETLIDAGKAVGLHPFGVEAQRILRLEKGHAILGVDTDALSNPLEAGLEWLVRFDKPQFHGKEPLERLQHRGPRSRLIGFRLHEAADLPADLRELEGCQVVQAGRPVGRVTSARRSPTLECPLGLAWVPAGLTKPGQRFLVREQGRDRTADVATLPFYDSEMTRLKC